MMTVTDDGLFHICRQPGFDPAWHRCLGCLIIQRDALLKAVESSFEFLDETLGWNTCKDDPDCGCILHDLHAAVDRARGR